MFSSTTISYRIETQPFNWNVTRSFADCVWLRDQLTKHYPSSIVPVSEAFLDPAPRSQGHQGQEKVAGGNEACVLAAAVL